jgi:hypothetical protein
MSGNNFADHLDGERPIDPRAETYTFSKLFRSCSQLRYHSKVNPFGRRLALLQPIVCAQRRGWLQVLFLLVAAFVVTGCLSPTLPLPPPSQPEITAPDSDGMVHIRGTVPPRSEVYAKNQHSLEIVGKETDDTGKYDLVMQAEINDRIIVWYSNVDVDRDFAEVLVPASDPVSGLGGAGN